MSAGREYRGPDRRYTPVMIGRFMLIWLVLLHAVAVPAFGAGGPGAIGKGVSEVLCAPVMPCVTDMGCCCQASPTEDQSQKPEPITSPARGLELLPIPMPPAIAWGGPDAIDFECVSSAPRIEPQTQLRRLARMCVWRT